jgi:hypothetical protein
MTPSATPSPLETPLSTPRSNPTAFTMLRRPKQRSIAQQLDEISREGNFDVDKVTDLPRVFVGARSFVREEWVHKKGQRGRTTWIKDHGVFMREILPDGTHEGKFWFCGVCDSRGKVEYFSMSATSAAGNHLKEYVILLYLGPR